MPLTDLQVRKAKPAEKPVKLADGGGLHLFIAPTGSKTWRLKYRVEGKEKLLTIGAYPDVSLDAAREARAAQKKLLREGGDPAEEKRVARRRAPVAAEGVLTFEKLARDWHALNKSRWTKVHAADVIHSLERDIFPELGGRDIRAITAPDVLAVLRKIEDRPAIETARRVRQRVSAVFVYGIASGLCEADPAAVVAGALRPLRRGRQPAVTGLEDARAILRAADASPAYPVTKLALRLLALTAVRPGTLIATPWSEFAGLDAERPTWRIPAARMKLKLDRKDDDRHDHLVPLPRQAVEVIEALRPFTGESTFVFPNSRRFHRPMSENAIGYMLNRAGYHGKQVPHGWRATFSSIMNERFPADRAVIDLMLAHVPKDRVEGAYNRAQHAARRAELAQIWADLLMVDQTPLAELVAGRRR